MERWVHLVEVKKLLSKQVNLGLPRQRYLGNLPGRLLFLYASASTIFGILGLVMNSSTWFMVATTYFKLSFPIWVFYLFLFMGIPTIAVLWWMFVTSSQVTVSNEQSYKHNNPGYEEILKIRKDVKLVKRHLGIEDED